MIKVLYFSRVPQDKEFNWITETATILSKSYPTVLCYWSKERSLFSALKKLILSVLFSHTEFQRVEFVHFFPSNRRVLKLISLRINLCLLQHTLFKNKKTILISSSPLEETGWIKRYLCPQLSVADCHDIWTDDESSQAKKYFDLVTVNGDNIFANMKKYFGNVQKISAGYFFEEDIMKVHKKALSKKKEKTLVLIATVTWRVNTQLLKELQKQLPDYQLVIIGTEKLENDEHQVELKELREQTILQWRELKKSKNVVYVKIKNGRELAQIDIEGSVGIITLDTSHIFNKHVNPVKTYYYFALGLPVVSTAVEGITTFSDYVWFSHDNSQFVRRVREAEKVSYTNGQKKQLLHFALEHSFEKKASALHDIISTHNQSF
jgi:hypothetical protein